MQTADIAARVIASAPTTLDDWLRAASVPAWGLCIACLSPAVWRLVRRQTRYLDALWVVVFLLALNRLSFLLRISAEVSHGTALGLALALAWLTTSYQARDRG